MVERETPDALSKLLKAVADPNRRRLLTILVQEGPLPVGGLAARFDITLNAVSKHIKVLEEAGLVSRRTDWREHVIAADMAPLATIEAWFGVLRSTWAVRLERLADIINEENDHDQ